MTTEPFLDAVKRGGQSEVEHLLSQDPGLLKSCTEGDFSPGLMADLLIERGAALDNFYSCAAGCLEQVISLQEPAPSLVNSYAPDGFQPLRLAAFFGHTGMVKFLLALGALLNTPSQNTLRVQLLHSVVAGQNLEIACELLVLGADVNACQAGGYTPLHAAAQNGQLGILMLSLENGADVGLKAFDGKTPWTWLWKMGSLRRLNFCAIEPGPCPFTLHCGYACWIAG